MSFRSYRRWRRTRALAQEHPGHAGARAAAPAALRRQLMRNCGSTRRSRCAIPRPGNTRVFATKTPGSPISATLSSGCRTGRGSSSGGARATSRSGPAGITPARVTNGPRSSPSPQGAVDCVEPLMDKELRYGTGRDRRSDLGSEFTCAGRYQSTDFEYKVWGDAGGRGLLFLSRRIRHPCRHPEGRPQERLRAERVHHPHARRAPIRLTSCPKTPSTPCSLTAASTNSDCPNPTLGRSGGQGSRQEGRPGDLPPAIRQGRGARGDLLQPRRDPAAAGRLRAVLRRRARWSRLATGEATGRWRGETRPATRSTTASQFTPCHNSVMSWAGSRPEPIQSADGAYARHAGSIAADESCGAGPG